MSRPRWNNEAVDPDVKRLFDELAQLNRDLLNRYDRSWKAIDRRFEEQTEQLKEQAAAMREQAAAMRDMRMEIRANTEGIFRVFDRLDGLEGA